MNAVRFAYISLKKKFLESCAASLVRATLIAAISPASCALAGVTDPSYNKATILSAAMCLTVEFAESVASP